MRKPTHAKRFEALGYTLERFAASDTRRIGQEGEQYSYYATKGDQLIEKFETAKAAAEWIEGREISKQR